MGFNLCAIFGIILSTMAVILLVFSEVGQLGDSLIPRHLRLAHIDTSGMAAASNAIYFTGTNEYLGSRNFDTGTSDGLRYRYEWGFWGYCATMQPLGGQPSYCVREGFGARFKPRTALLGDAPAAAKTAFGAHLPIGVFAAEGYLGAYSHGANYIGFIGALLSVIALIVSAIPKRATYLLGAVCALLGAAFLMVSLAIYTAILVKVRNEVQLAKIGMVMKLGNGLYVAWAADILLVAAVIPYFLACCVGDDSDDEYDHEDPKY